MGPSSSTSQPYNRGPPHFNNPSQEAQPRQGDSVPLNMEAMLQKVMEGQTNILSEVKRTNAKCEECVQKVQESDTRFKSLETQVGHLTHLMQQRQPGTLPSNTEVDPRGKAQCKAVTTLRSGKKVGQEDEPGAENSDKDLQGLEESEEEVDAPGKEVAEPTPGSVHRDEEQEVPRSSIPIPSPSQEIRYAPEPPFPIRKPREKAMFNNRQFEQFVNLIRKVNVNISF